jgi:outer membrane biosynthesis protein TonB
MAPFAHLRREERIGLGIAAAAHVALLAALVLHVRDDATKLPIPERMEVSLASEVSLESTAPDPSAEPQAAIAPVLSPEPEPLPQPVQQEVMERVQPAPQPTRRPSVTPAPRPTASPRPTPTPTARPEPRPTQASRSGGSRLGEDFLEGAGGSERSESTGTPAATFGAAESAALQQAIARQLKPHWSAPQGPDVEKLVTIVRFRLNPDGTLAGNPSVVSQSGVTPVNETQKGRHAEQAIRAVRLAAPFDLPEEFYDKWKTVNSRFDRRL